MPTMDVVTAREELVVALTQMTWRTTPRTQHRMLRGCVLESLEVICRVGEYSDVAFLLQLSDHHGQNV